MKKLIIALLAAITISVSANDITVPVSTVANLRITVAANGTIDGPPQWQVAGTGTLQVDPGGMSALLVTNGAGTNVVTITATAGGNPLVSHVTAVVTAPLATVLAVSAGPVPK